MLATSAHQAILDAADPLLVGSHPLGLIQSFRKRIADRLFDPAGNCSPLATGHVWPHRTVRSFPAWSTVAIVATIT